jgi:sugar phosphate isomerase/epimerase
MMIYVSHIIPDDDIKEVVEKTGCGIESIEFSMPDNLDNLPASIRAYRKRLKYIGAKSLTFHGPFLDLNPMTFDREIQKVVMKRYQQVYIAAQALGAKKIVFHSGLDPDLYYLQGWAERMRDFFLEYLEDRKSIEIELENVLDREWEPLRDTVEMVGKDNFHVCFDMGHAHAYSKIPVIEWAKGLAPAAGHIHVHDNDSTDDQHLALGHGTIPYRDIFNEIKEHGIGPTYTIEAESKEDALETIKVMTEECGISING